ncbi:SMC-Scp complex subunit ScpB [Gordonia aichiensis]|uniref:Chromosome segregation and condensation protein ScpB n=1 Tax=Gordonia aichiensis NBRC 108223 TaxID=1220583 RepID=L7KR65_9ACTN|nr:SMC-Scp complex subunit ScpB [Gordonia aichiensis]GAC50966.1 chromosome segregation and condensation protein ScpB [Gordonia aichiensis NBRC 108223]
MTDIDEESGSTDAVEPTDPGQTALDVGGGDVDGGGVDEGGVDGGGTEEVETDAALDDDRLRAALEAVLLVVDTPVTADELATAVGDERSRVHAMLTAMAADLTDARSGFDLRFAGDGWRFYTRAEYAPYVERLLLDGARSKLTRAALETLAVVAYRQPVSRARVSAIRGVNVDGVIRTLVARGLINEVGSDPASGATTYGTTELFLERLGLASLGELPDLAPLLPDVDVIDDLDEELSSDPRFAKLSGGRSDSKGDDLPDTSSGATIDDQE